MENKELRKKLQECENKGSVYNGKLNDDTLGTYWVGSDKEVIYEYTTDNIDLTECDITDEQLEEVKIYEL